MSKSGSSALVIPAARMSPGRGVCCDPARGELHAAARLCGTFGSLANSPASVRRMKSARVLSVRYGLPAMFTVTNQPLRRARDHQE